MKAYFFSRVLREKLLLVVFVALGAAIWLSSVSDRTTRFVREFNRTSGDLAEQKLWLEQRDAIQAKAKAAIENLDPAKTYSAVRLSAEVRRIADTSGLGPATSSEPPRTENAGQFSVNTMQVAIRRAELAALLRLNEEVGKRAPYMSIEQFDLSADRANPALLNASLRISSVEITR